MNKSPGLLISRLKTPSECESFIDNVKDKHPELVIAARRRAVELKAASHGATSAAEQDAVQAIYATEAALTHKNGKRTRASRTWQMVDKLGIIATVERIVGKKAASDGYALLAELGMLDYSFEAVVLRHPQDFSVGVIEAARERLAGEN
jgi:hypothetical protein